MLRFQSTLHNDSACFFESFSTEGRHLLGPMERSVFEMRNTDEVEGKKRAYGVRELLTDSAFEFICSFGSSCVLLGPMLM